MHSVKSEYNTTKQKLNSANGFFKLQFFLTILFLNYQKEVLHGFLKIAIKLLIVKTSFPITYTYTCTLTVVDPGFQVRGGALKKIVPSGGMRTIFWGISYEKSRFYAKKSYFFPILGGGARRVHPPLDPPLQHINSEYALTKNMGLKKPN